MSTKIFASIVGVAFCSSIMTFGVTHYFDRQNPTPVSPRVIEKASAMFPTLGDKSPRDWGVRETSPDSCDMMQIMFNYAGAKNGNYEKVECLDFDGKPIDTATLRSLETENERNLNERTEIEIVFQLKCLKSDGSIHPECD